MVKLKVLLKYTDRGQIMYGLQDKLAAELTYPLRLNINRTFHCST